MSSRTATRIVLLREFGQAICLAEARPLSGSLFTWLHVLDMFLGRPISNGSKAMLTGSVDAMLRPWQTTSQRSAEAQSWPPSGSTDTAPEMLVRKALHRLGFRYHLHRKDLPGSPDLVFPSRGKAIFVHGCFWHGHGCRWGRLPKTKLEYWAPKIEANRARDARKQSELHRAGWKSLVVWQCELRNPDGALGRIMAFLDDD